MRIWLVAAVFSGLLLAGCSRREQPAPQAQTAAPETAASVAPAAPAAPTRPTTTGEAVPAAETAAPATTAAAPSAAPKSPQRMSVSPGKAPAAAAKPTSSPVPEATPQSAASEPAPSPTPAAPGNSAPPQASVSKVDDPGGTVAVVSTKSGATRIGAEKCKVCHKLQYASWAENAHARRTPPLDCESCHGPGSEYKSLSVMKDLAAAKAAGLVLPDASFCARCHKRDWKSDMLARAHAHKAKSAP